jgi:hypothetical protein
MAFKDNKNMAFKDNKNIPHPHITPAKPASD